MNVLKFPRPRTFTSNEAFIERVREAIFANGKPYKEIAADVGVGTSTVQNLATGKTKWPRPTTLFPLLAYLKLEIRVVRVR